MSRKDASFDQLLEYFNKEKKKEHTTIVHNLRSPENDEHAISQEFKDNHDYSKKRTNGVVLFHEVMSFSPEDSKNITPDVLDDLARQYIRKRANNTLVYAKIHQEQSNLHIHFMISGNLLRSHKKLRLSRSRFNRIKHELEQYQLDKYPFLDKSIATRFEREKRGLEVKEKTKGRKKKELSRRRRKEIELIEKYTKCLKAFTHEEYCHSLQECGLEEYLHGNTPGIRDLATGQKHRLKTLGVLEMYQKSIQCWKTQQERLQEIRCDRNRKIIKQYLDLHYREQVLEVLCPDLSERVKELRAIQMKKNIRRRDVFDRSVDI